MSAESAAVSAVYNYTRERMKENPTMGLQEGRALIEAFGDLAAEPTGVTYEEVPYPFSIRPAIWCKPLSATPSRVILYLHGGGGYGGSPSSHRKLAGHLATAASSLALIPDYRLVPENPFPAGLDDAIAAYQWLLEQKFSPANIVIAGDSAGGNLTAASLLKLKELKLPYPAAAALLSPWLDMECLGESRKFNMQHDALSTPELGPTSSKLYCGETSPKNPFANPLYGDWKGLPPLYISAAGWDTLLSDATTLAEIAKRAGVETVLDVAPQMQHVYHFMVGRAPEATKSIDEVGRWLATKFGE